MFSMLSQPNKNFAKNFLQPARVLHHCVISQPGYAFFNHEWPFASQESPPNMLQPARLHRHGKA
jgi:hypothetical protein